MERLSFENVQRFIDLNNELVFEDPYVIKLTKDEFMKKHKEELEFGDIDIFIMSNQSEDIGFIELSIEDDTLMIEEIYVRKKYRNFESYTDMLDFIQRNYYNKNIERVNYIGVNDKMDLIKALKNANYIIEKEHIQMEKNISSINKINNSISYRTFYEIGDGKWIYHFMKNCMEGSIFNYKVEDIIELTHKNNDLAFILYEDMQPIGFVISDINEIRNKQQKVNVIYIEEIAILKKFRNKGYGFKVIEYVTNKGNEKGMEIARLHVYRDNEKACRLYKKLGFNEVKSIGHWYKILG